MLYMHFHDEKGSGQHWELEELIHFQMQTLINAICHVLRLEH
ncbi:unnamed protein product [Staurois parvus]|uniref:Uncharacterized protein n=1 Tax=Staurois parvus TaxID=386267 RepID=A0ABN9HDJ6_9NEOB|nr:unnamed protein product [Staurois parvus]